MANYHLMRTKVPSRVYRRLEEIAEEISAVRGKQVYVSEIVRAALTDWVIDYDCLAQLAENVISEEAQ